MVSISSRLNFVETAYEDFMPPASFPVEASNPTEAFEAVLSSRNFLFMAMRTGIAREVIHIVPDEIYFERYRRQAEGVTVRENETYVPFFGSPRTITTLSFFEARREPVLLYISASFFREYEPEELFGQLLGKGLKTDYAVLCMSFDDADVGDEERLRLKRFEMLLGGAGSGR